MKSDWWWIAAAFVLAIVVLGYTYAQDKRNPQLGEAKVERALLTEKQARAYADARAEGDDAFRRIYLDQKRATIQEMVKQFRQAITRLEIDNPASVRRIMTAEEQAAFDPDGTKTDADYFAAHALQRNDITVERFKQLWQATPPEYRMDVMVLYGANAWWRRQVTLHLEALRMMVEDE